MFRTSFVEVASTAVPSFFKPRFLVQEGNFNQTWGEEPRRDVQRCWKMAGSDLGVWSKEERLKGWRREVTIWVGSKE